MNDKHISLLPFYRPNILEAGCDEAGRGCLAGDVFAAAVIFPSEIEIAELNDSKQITDKQRYRLRPIIEQKALAFAVASCTPKEIDEVNILWASVMAMHRALSLLTIEPEHIIVDGNRFKPFCNINHTCVVKGDCKYLSIAAASVLAKTYRDDYMLNLHNEFPYFDWNKNKGYPTKAHREGIKIHGATMYHRKSFRLI